MEFETWANLFDTNKIRLDFQKELRSSVSMNREYLMYLRDTTFMICCAARTGSTLLVHLLRSNPEIFCHGEVLALDELVGIQGVYAQKMKNDQGIKKALMNERSVDPGRFLYKYILDGQGKRISGFKYKTDELFLPKYKHITDLTVNDTDIKIIFLLRKNLLAQFSSHQVVLKQTGVTLVKSDEERPQINPIKICLTELLAYVDNVDNVVGRQKKAEQLYCEYRTFKVYYEDVSTQNHESLFQLQEFLGAR